MGFQMRLEHRKAGRCFSLHFFLVSLCLTFMQSNCVHAGSSARTGCPCGQRETSANPQHIKAVTTGKEQLHLELSACIQHRSVSCLHAAIQNYNMP